MNKGSNLFEFLDTIDPEKKLDRQKVLADITAIALLKAIVKSRSLLPLESSQKLDTLLGSSPEMNLDQIYDLFGQANKKSEFLENVDQVSKEMTVDYILTQTKALTTSQKDELIKKYPAMNDLINPSNLTPQ